MAEITIPQQDITIGSFNGKNGSVQFLSFAAMYEGKILASCQALGGADRKKELEAAMASGAAVPIAQPPVLNEKFHRYDIRFPGGSFGGSSGKQWTPAGYRGQALTPDAYWKGMTDALIQAKAALTTAGLDPDVEVVQDLAAQFWIMVERNVIALPGVSSTGQTAGKAAGNSDGAGKERQANIRQAYIEDIEMCGDTDAVDAVMATVRREVKDKVLQADLLAECIKAKRNLTSSESGL